MRLGIVTDIHEDADALRDVLAALEARSVDRVVHLGDVADFGRDLDATCAVLAERGIAGVWGNHDLGLTAAADAEVAAAIPVTPATRAAMRTLEPSMRLPVPAGERLAGGVHLSHAGPWVDPYDALGMWTAAPRQLDDVELVRAGVAGTGCRVALMGHHHRWDLLVDGVRRPWDGTSELVLPADRSALVVVAAVRDRRGLVLDTVRGSLEPVAAG